MMPAWGLLQRVSIRSHWPQPFLPSWNLHKVELFSASVSHLDDISSWKCSWKCKSLQFERKTRIASWILPGPPFHQQVGRAKQGVMNEVKRENVRESRILNSWEFSHVANVNISWQRLCETVFFGFSLVKAVIDFLVMSLNYLSANIWRSFL